MKTPARIGLYVGGLGAIFVASAAVAGAVVPDETAQAWSQSSGQTSAQPHSGETHGTDDADGTDRTGGQQTSAGASMVGGLSLEQDGYLLGEVSAPESVRAPGRLTFTVLDPQDEPVTEFDASHDKRLHLIVVRSDGQHFRHVHPTMDADGRWSIPWTWDAAGTYRVYADAVPTDGQAITLTRTVDVTGDLTAAPEPEVATTSSVDGFDVALHGELQAGEASQLTVEVTRDGQPVTALEPYLGAYGHLVALRAGDLAYLHVHPEGTEPAADELSGPNVTFSAQAPTPGRYLLYLDFQVDGKVHTATFQVDVAPANGRPTPTKPAPAPAPAPAPEDHDAGSHDH